MLPAPSVCTAAGANHTTPPPVVAVSCYHIDIVSTLRQAAMPWVDMVAPRSLVMVEVTVKVRRAIARRVHDQETRGSLRIAA